MESGKPLTADQRDSTNLENREGRLKASRLRETIDTTAYPQPMVMAEIKERYMARFALGRVCGFPAELGRRLKARVRADSGAWQFRHRAYTAKGVYALSGEPSRHHRGSHHRAKHTCRKTMALSTGLPEASGGRVLLMV
jgi:hypothetical protein